MEIIKKDIIAESISAQKNTVSVHTKLKQRKCWIKDHRKTRKARENFKKLLKDLHPKTENFFQIDEICFNKILAVIKNDIEKKNTIMREAVSPEERLAITLRFLTTGERLRDLDAKSNISYSIIASTVIDVCDAIYKNMKSDYLKFPTTKGEWITIAEEYNNKWHFPLCMGALKAWHVPFTPFKINASLYYNSQGFHSMILLAISDAKGKFIFVDIGCNGGVSESDALLCSDLMHVLQQNRKYLPAQKKIGSYGPLPYAFIGNNCFPLMKNLIVPYLASRPTNKIKQNFNERLYQAMEPIERAFNILINRFRVLQKPFKYNEAKTQKIVQCCFVLHNFFMANNSLYADIPFCSNTSKYTNDINSSISSQSICTIEQQNINEIIRQTWANNFFTESNEVLTKGDILKMCL